LFARAESRLREIFLKYNNHIKGKYLAELTQQVFEDLESNKYQLSEYRLSIYGAKPNEWDALAAWVVDHKLFSANVRWMIQVPRLYSIYKASGQIKNFAEMLHSQSKQHTHVLQPFVSALGPWLILPACVLFCVFSSQTSSTLCSW
jgi:adenosine deaminase